MNESNTATTVETVPPTTVKRGRGRPPVYTTEQREMFANLIADRGVTGTQKLLNSRNGSTGVAKTTQADARVRKQLGFDKPLKISMPTLLKIAKAAGVTLRRGRRAKVDGFDGNAANLPIELT